MGDSARPEGGVAALADVHVGMGNAVPVNIFLAGSFRLLGTYLKGRNFYVTAISKLW